MNIAISRESIGLFLICTVDMVLTVMLVAMGLAKEANPLMAYCIERGYLTFCAVKMSTTILAIAAAERYRRHNPRFVKRLLQCAIALYLLLYFSLLIAINLA